jgi:hypothetical protein
MSKTGTKGEWHESHWWCDYFRRQKSTLLRQPWCNPTRLPADESELIADSLQEFQQGEGLEGGYFYQVVREEARRTGDDAYAEAHTLFMAEEKRHARDLGAFLDLEQIPRLPANTPRNWLFCFLARQCSFELILMIVVNVEIIAQAYYGALRRATSSRLLRGICTQILRDEAMHVRFHCERQAFLRRSRSALLQFATQILDFVLFCGAWLVCLSGHRKVLKAGRLTTMKYWNEARAYRRRAARMMNPHTYKWPEIASNYGFRMPATNARSDAGR